MKKLSIITINYNDAEGLDNTIKSVISQSFKDFQYIVIDGGSKDGSKDVLEKYKGRLDVAISEPDKGIYNAMNKGASYATGEYLMFLNSGDTLYDESVLEQLFSLSFDEDIICSRVYNYSNVDAFIKIPPEIVSLYTFSSGSLPHPSAIIKRSLFNAIGGYIEKYKIVSDWCFFIDALLIHNCSYKTTSILLIKFNRYGISSNNNTLGSIERSDYLEKKFGRIMLDYLPASEESLSNFIFWINGMSGLTKKIAIFPIKVLNRLFHLRNRLSRRMGTVKTSGNVHNNRFYTQD